MKALIIYAPALHRAYIELFKKHHDASIFLLGSEFVHRFPRMERDIRALDADSVKKALNGMGFSNVKVLKESDLKRITKSDKVIMPEEDVSHNFVKKHLQNKDVEFVNVFLRWDKSNTKKKSAVITNEAISRDEFDRRMMIKAREESKKSPDWWRQIGAVIVKDGKALVSGFNKPLPITQIHNIFGDPRSNYDHGESYELSKFIHAEAGLIAVAAKNGMKIDGASIYVTTFPCPSCAKSIAVAGIKEVYYSEGYSLLDAEDILKSFGVKIVRVRED